MIPVPPPPRPPQRYDAEEEAQYRVSVSRTLQRLVQPMGLLSVDVDGTYQITREDGVVRCDTTTAGFTATLPPVGMVKGRVVWVKKVSTDGNTLTVDGYSTEQIDGSDTLAWTTANLAHCFFSNGVSWDVLV